MDQGTQKLKSLKTSGLPLCLSHYSYYEIYTKILVSIIIGITVRTNSWIMSCECIKLTVMIYTVYFEEGNNRWPDTELYITTVDSVEKCSGPLSALSMNDQPENGGHKGCAGATHPCVITFSARRQHRKSVSAHHFVPHEASLQVTAAAPALMARRNYRAAFSHRPCIQTNRWTEWQDRPNRLAEVTGSWTEPWPDIGQLNSRRLVHKQYRLGVLIT